MFSSQGSDKENVDTNHPQVATTKPPLPPGTFQRASSDQRRVPKDVTRVQLQTKATPRTEEQPSSRRSAATQTHDSPPPPAAGPPLHHACTQTEEASKEEAKEEAGAPPLSWAPRGGLSLSGSFPIPGDPARLAERIRRNRSQLSAAFDDTEYEPYGLPEVVMKGEWKTPLATYGKCVMQQS